MSSNYIQLIYICRCSSDGKYVMVSSPDSETLYLLSQDVATEFDVFGHIVLEGYILNACFAEHDKEMKALAVLTNTCMAGFSLPKKINPDNRMEPLPDSVTKP